MQNKLLNFNQLTFKLHESILPTIFVTSGDDNNFPTPNPEIVAEVTSNLSGGWSPTNISTVTPYGI